jgi:hypothetical protein
MKTNHNTISIITTIKQAQPVFEQAQPNDLFVFDIDFTLMEPVDPVFQQRNTLPAALNGSLTAEQLALIPLFKDLFTALAATNSVEKMFSTFKNGPAEPETLIFINNLRSRGIRVICLTARTCTEKTNTFKEIHDLGLDIASSFPGIKYINFDELNYFSKKPLLPGDVCYDKGIIFAASVPKGIVLTEFFKRIGYQPERVFFFDDHRRNSISVSQALQKLDIPSHCFVYLAKRVREDTHLDPSIVKKQFEYIKEHATYISYEDAQKIFYPNFPLKSNA